MTSDPTPKQTAGFTLAELLVVVGIIGVLVAIAIPLFTASLESAKEATCQANRRSMYAEVVTKAMGTSESEADVFAGLNVEGKIYTCPDNGTWTWNENSRVIKCSIHGLTVDEEMYDWITKNSNLWLSNGTMDTNIWEEYKKITDKWPTVTGDNGTLYLKFKSYDSKYSGVFLFASSLGSDVGNHGQWKADYVCDSTGLRGTPGQWYKVPVNSSVALNSAEDIKILLESGTEVNLVDGKFVKAS